MVVVGGHHVAVHEWLMVCPSVILHKSWWQFQHALLSYPPTIVNNNPTALAEALKEDISIHTLNGLSYMNIHGLVDWGLPEQINPRISGARYQFM